MKTVAVIQARLGSTRLPRKVLLDLAGQPMLARVVARARRAKLVDEVVVATTDDPADTPLAEYCAARAWPCLRGSHHDVLDRYYQAASQYSADVIVRITGDCPLLDPAMVDSVIAAFRDHGPLDYAANTLEPRTYPRGLDTEVFSFRALETAWREDDNGRGWREHVTPYLYRHPERFRLHAVRHPVDHSDLRWTVDTMEDLTLVRQVYDHFGHDRFSWTEAFAAFLANPAWRWINQDAVQKPVA